MYLRGETHLRLCTLSSPPSEKTSGGRKKYLIPPVCGGSNRHRLICSKETDKSCVFLQENRKNLLHGVPKSAGFPAAFLLYSRWNDLSRVSCRFYPCTRAGILPAVPHPPIRRDSRTLQRIRTSQSNKNFPHVPATLKKRNKIPLRKWRGNGGSSGWVREVWRVGRPLRKGSPCASKVFLPFPTPGSHRGGIWRRKHRNPYRERDRLQRDCL